MGAAGSVSTCLDVAAELEKLNSEVQAAGPTAKQSAAKLRKLERRLKELSEVAAMLAVTAEQAERADEKATSPAAPGEQAEGAFTVLDPAQATRAAIATEVERVKALPDDELARIGKQYTDPEELWIALEAGGGNATLMLRASWLKTQSVDKGFRIPKRGDKLPPEATITVAELREIAKASDCKYGALPAISLSHFWRTKEDPDPDGETAKLVIAALQERWTEFQSRGVTDLGVIIDFSALWQAPRETPEKVRAFEEGLKGINQWYAHQGTTVWLITAGADRVKGLSYWDKGWTSFEFALAMLIKPANTSDLKDWAQVVDLGKRGSEQTQFERPPLSEPLAFFGGHKCGDKTYTNGADRDRIVAPKFRETMFGVMGGVSELNFGKLKWGDAEIEALAAVLPLCGQLTKLQVHMNGFGDVGMIALAGAMGSLASVSFLDLSNNKIGDAGMIKFSEALATGAMASVRTLWLGGNQIGDAGMEALSSALACGALPALRQLWMRQDAPVLKAACEVRGISYY